MTTAQIIKKYGTPNETGAGYLVKIQLPYPMRLAWDLDTKVNTMMCHKLVADKFLSVFNEIHRSNMTKLEPDGKVRRREDGKILKPETYERPNLKQFFKDESNS